MAVEHLSRLSLLARQDHELFTRDGGRPEYRDRRLLVVLAQGAALHYAHHMHGVKDLDVWTFYAAIPGTRFPADKRETHADFGPSVFGRQTYDLTEARNPYEVARWRRWDDHEGRRVDFLMRPLPVSPDAGIAGAVDALQHWLEVGSSQAATRPSAWWLSFRPVVIIDPPRRRGQVVWDPTGLT
jgi:hypothetical protein